jgi:hypothetical protein
MLFLSSQISWAANPPAGGRYDELPDRAFGVRCLFRVFPAVREASAAAVSVDSNGAAFYWSLGDSGTATALGRTDLATLKTERVQLADRMGNPRVANLDWESMATGADGHLWIIDGGGNNFDRESIMAYEIDPHETIRPLPVLRCATVLYPRKKKPTEESGPDVEASFIYNGSLYLIEKTLLGAARIFWADLESAPTNSPAARIKARQIGTLSPSARKDAVPIPIEAVTDASLCGTNVYLLTYFGVYALPADEFTKAAKTDSAGGIIGQDSLEFLFSIVGRSGIPTQAEGLVALSRDQFLISREDGRVFCWRNGRFEEPAPRAPLLRNTAEGK